MVCLSNYKKITSYAVQRVVRELNEAEIYVFVR